MLPEAREPIRATADHMTAAPCRPIFSFLNMAAPFLPGMTPADADTGPRHHRPANRHAIQNHHRKKKPVSIFPIPPLRMGAVNKIVQNSRPERQSVPRREHHPPEEAGHACSVTAELCRNGQTFKPQRPLQRVNFAGRPAPCDFDINHLASFPDFYRCRQAADRCSSSRPYILQDSGRWQNRR